MQYPITTILLVGLVLAAPRAAPPRQAWDDTSYFPSRFAVEIGGFGGPSYRVEMRAEKLYYRAEIWAPERKVIEKVITPTQGQWRSFWQEAEKIQLWQWSREYFNHEIADGTQWRVNIEYDGKAINSSGSNAYPLEGDVTKPNKTPAPSVPFNQFIKAVRALIGDLPFQ